MNEAFFTLCPKLAWGIPSAICLVRTLRFQNKQWRKKNIYFHVNSGSLYSASNATRCHSQPEKSVRFCSVAFSLDGRAQAGDRRNHENPEACLRFHGDLLINVSKKCQPEGLFMGKMDVFTMCFPCVSNRFGNITWTSLCDHNRDHQCPLS